ncbi:MAG: phosphopantothenoylcysteine decarboxylase [Myxococcota bacterium]
MKTPVLITAGATRNPLDAIRYISAHSTGSTGVWLAEQLAPTMDVTLMGSPQALLRAADLPIRREGYTSTRDLLARMKGWLDGRGRAVVIHACAVGDYEMAPTNPKIPDEKIPSGKAELVLRLRPTPKIIDQLHDANPALLLYSFKAASPETTDAGLIEIAERQRVRTRSMLVFANVIGRLGARVLLQGETSTWHGARADAMADLVARIQAQAG